MRTFVLATVLGLAALTGCETSQHNEMAPAAAEAPEGFVIADYAYLERDP